MNQFIRTFLFLTVEGFAFTMNDSILSNDAVVRGIKPENLKLDLPHTAANCEHVADMQRPIGLEEIRSKVDIKKRTAQFPGGITNLEEGNSFRLAKMTISIVATFAVALWKF